MLFDLLDSPDLVQSLPCLTPLSVDGPECALAQELIADPFFLFAELAFLG